MTTADTAERPAKSERWIRWVKKHWQGFAIAVLVAMAATFLSEHYGAPTMLFALLIGLSLGFLSEHDDLKPGLGFSAKHLLRLGVGLLGLQLAFTDVQALGGLSVGATSLLVVATLGLGIALSFATARRFAYGILSGGAVAVCGASAALAFSAVLPSHPKREEDTVLVVISVTVLSTVAMVLYPILFQSLNYSDLQTGFMIGATIHDVAQVVGAGYSVSEEAGLVATLVKMLRVACLPILVIVVHLSFRSRGQAGAFVPWFLTLFIVMAVTRSVLPIPEAVLWVMGQASQWMLVIAIAALALQTNLRAVTTVHPMLLIILVIETLFILGGAMLYATYFLN
ncbi:YeiH family protein [Litoreibacter albidus]|uniref:YeiH family protein n=1 Tax=Litoreibacter albidus TaxID=670155 RepID=UPI003736106C